MVHTAVAGVGAGLLLVGAVLTVVIAIIQQWAVATIQTSTEQVCSQDNPLGTLGLFQSSYIPSCTEGSVFAGDYADNFVDEDLPTTEFWPLFPSQNTFGGFFDAAMTAVNGRNVEFDNCESFYNTTAGAEGDAILGANAFLQAGASSSFASAAGNAAVAAGYTEFEGLINLVWTGLDGFIAGQWQAGVAKALDGNATSPGYIRGVQSLLQLHAGLISAVNGTCFAGSGGALSFTFSDVDTTVIGSCTAVLIGSGFAPTLTGSETWLDLLSLMNTTFVGGIMAPSVGLPAAIIASSLGKLPELIGELAAGCDLACVSSSYGAVLSKNLNVPSQLASVPLASYKTGTLFASTNFAAGAGFILGFCPAALDYSECSTTITGVQNDLNAAWAFCSLAVAGGLIPSPSGTCSPLYLFQALGSNPAVLAAQLGSAFGALPEEYAAILPQLISLLVDTLSGCAGGSVPYSVCDDILLNPSLTQAVQSTVAQQKLLVPDNFTMNYALCAPILIDASALGLNTTVCETYAQYVIARLTIYAFLLESPSSSVDIAAYDSFAPLGKLWLLPCILNGVVTKSGCVAFSFTRTAVQNADNIVSVLQKFVSKCTNTTCMTEKCNDNEDDIAAIELAQILVPAAIGAEMVGLLVAILGVKKNSTPLTAVGGALGIVGVAMAAAGLVNVQAAPMFDLITDTCPIDEACYEGGVAKTIAYAGLALPLVASITLIVAALLRRGGEESAITGKVESY